MNFCTWNVNGLRACMNKGFMEFFNSIDADIFAVQETKLQPGQISLDLDGYEQFFNSAEKKGYSGTAVFVKRAPISVHFGINAPYYDTEGRVITLEYEKYYFVTVYTPNSQRELARLDYRMSWEEVFAGYLCGLDRKKPVIVCGDLNVAHKEIDLKNPKTNRNNAGFTDAERNKFTELLGYGFVDAFRHLYPELTDAYTWWSYMANSRARNIGWRIDYFLVSERIKDAISGCRIMPEVMGSDHCPVCLELDEGMMAAPVHEEAMNMHTISV